MVLSHHRPGAARRGGLRPHPEGVHIPAYFLLTISQPRTAAPKSSRAGDRQGLGPGQTRGRASGPAPARPFPSPADQPARARRPLPPAAGGGPASPRTQPGQPCSLRPLARAQGLAKPVPARCQAPPHPQEQVLCQRKNKNKSPWGAVLWPMATLRSKSVSWGAFAQNCFVKRFATCPPAPRPAPQGQTEGRGFSEGCKNFWKFCTTLVRRTVLHCPLLRGSVQYLACLPHCILTLSGDSGSGTSTQIQVPTGNEDPIFRVRP